MKYSGQWVVMNTWRNSLFELVSITDFYTHLEGSSLAWFFGFGFCWWCFFRAGVLVWGDRWENVLY